MPRMRNRRSRLRSRPSRPPRPGTTTQHSPSTRPRRPSWAGTPSRSCRTSSANFEAETGHAPRHASGSGFKVRVGGGEDGRRPPVPPDVALEVSVLDAVTNPPMPVNEPVRGYAPGSPERVSLEARLKELAAERIDLPMTIGGEQRMGSGARIDVVQPHN